MNLFIFTRCGVIKKRDSPLIRKGHDFLDELILYGFLRVHEEETMENKIEYIMYSTSWNKKSIF